MVVEFVKLMLNSYVNFVSSDMFLSASSDLFILCERCFSPLKAGSISSNNAGLSIFRHIWFYQKRSVFFLERPADQIFFAGCGRLCGKFIWQQKSLGSLSWLWFYWEEFFGLGWIFPEDSISKCFALSCEIYSWCWKEQRQIEEEGRYSDCCDCCSWVFESFFGISADLIKVCVRFDSFA